MDRLNGRWRTGVHYDLDSALGLIDDSAEDLVALVVVEFVDLRAISDSNAMNAAPDRVLDLGAQVFVQDLACIIERHL